MGATGLLDDCSLKCVVDAIFRLADNAGINLGAVTQVGSDIDGERADDNSGFSVSLNNAGDRVAIGAISNSDNGLFSGQTRIYEFNGTNWIQLGSDIDGERAVDLSGYSVSLNATGNIVAIGAIFNDDNGPDAGQTRIYEFNGTEWIQLGSDIDGEAMGDNSGYSISLNDAGNIVAIGAIFNDGNGADSGHTRIYKFNGSQWNQLGPDIDGEAMGDWSGFSVSLNSVGDRVAIGAINNNGNGSTSGQTRIYQFNGTEWIQLGSDIDGEVMGDNSGASVSLNSVGDIVAIGAYSNLIIGNGAISGQTRIYQFNGTEWIQLGSDIDGEPDGNDNAYKAISVSLNSVGNIVAIGASFNDDNGQNSGQTRIYRFNGTQWVKFVPDIEGEAQNDSSGYSVSLNCAGDTVAIGAFGNDDNGVDSGHVRVYSLENSLENCLQTILNGLKC